MNSKRTYVATFWRSNLQLKNGGYYTTKEFQSVSLQGATKQAERYAASNMYGGMAARDYKFEYMLLNRLQHDCNYYLGHDEQKQIDKMRELYDLLPVKPEWLTREQIDEYAARMNVK